MEHFRFDPKWNLELGALEKFGVMRDKECSARPGLPLNTDTSSDEKNLLLASGGLVKY